MARNVSKLGSGSIKIAARPIAVAIESLGAYATPALKVKPSQYDKGFARQFDTSKLPQLKTLTALDKPKFASALKAALDAEGVGYAAGISAGGKLAYSFSAGFALQPVDGNSRWTIGTRQHLASVSKSFTAVSLVQLLRQRGIAYDALVRDYLPTAWKLGEKAHFMTFRKMLTHQGGFWDSHCTWDELRDHLAVASDAIAEGYHYSNTNFALMRILIPILNGDVDRAWTADDALWDATTRKYFNDYSQAHLWQPAGIQYASLKSNYDLIHTPPYANIPEITNLSLAYAYPLHPNGHGGDISSDCTSIAGAVGWHLSVADMLQAAHAVRSGKIIPKAVFTEMCDNCLGLDGWHTPVGTFYFHDGCWTDGDNHGHVSHLSFMPGNIEVAVLSNQKRDHDDGTAGLPNLCDVVEQAYVAAMPPP